MADFLPELAFAIAMLGVYAGFFKLFKRGNERAPLAIGILITLGFMAFSIYRNVNMPLYTQYLGIFILAMLICAGIPFVSYVTGKHRRR